MLHEQQEWKECGSEKNLNVVAGFNGALEDVFKRGQRAGAFVHARVLGRDLPDADFAVLVPREDFLSRQDYGFDQSAVGFEPRILLQVLPHTNVLAVGPRVQEVTGSRQRVYVSLLSDKRTHERVLRQAPVLARNPLHLLKRRTGVIVPRRHHHRGTLAAKPTLVVEIRTHRRRRTATPHCVLVVG